MIIILILIAVLVYILFRSSTECLSVKPSNLVKMQLADEIVKNKELFNNRYRFDEARNQLSWLDAVTYEDARKLSLDGKLSTDLMIKYL